ncbi:permease of the major facilitator superfamily [Glonium stellatum]|uniref:Permease of the major facilitator superfamily n=1 Tax=Glonium stellatum TaxID=574774 RepID=A0A8E2F4N8_9PEZI|nr:permease of the major facilitator superfamily [Glonium stellatum]
MAALNENSTSRLLKDADDAFEALEKNDRGHREIDEATNRRLLKKIDTHLMPLLCVVYALNFLDKATFSYAAVMGITEPASKGGIGISSSEYSWLGSIFYFGYLAWEYPTSRLLQYLPLGKYSAFNIIMWGIMLSCLALVRNFSQAMAVRFFLGLFESAVTPGFTLFTSQWYTKREQGTRIGIWFSFNGVAGTCGGFLAYGIARGFQHREGYPAWKVLFLVTGLFTIAIGIIFLWAIPDNQLNAWWLNRKDRLLAIERIRINQQGIGNRTWKKYQIKEAILDPLTWAFFLYALIATVPNGITTTFFSLLIKSFGYTPTESLLYGTPNGVIQVLALVSSSYLGDRYGRRMFLGSCGLVFSIIGVMIMIAVPNNHRKGRLAGAYFTGTAATGLVAILSLIASNVAGYTKKTTVAALFLIGYCVGNIIGPQTIRGNNFLSGEIIMLVCWIVCVLDLIFIWWFCKRRNKQKAQLKANPGYQKVDNQEWFDLTDKENGEFIYTL